MLEQILKGIVDRMEEREKNQVRVGRVSKEVSMELKKVSADHKAAHLAIRDKIEAYIEKLTDEHDCTPFNDRKMDAWEKIYNELDIPQIDRTKSYRIDHDTRVVYLTKDEDEDGIEIEVGFKVR